MKLSHVLAVGGRFAAEAGALTAERDALAKTLEAERAQVLSVCLSGDTTPCRMTGVTSHSVSMSLCLYVASSLCLYVALSH